MREAAIVSTVRTPIGKAYRGAFNDTSGQELAGHAIRAAVERAGVEPGLIEDVVLGCAMQEGSTGFNVARQAALRAGLPTSVPGTTMDRQCSSGLLAIATAAKQVIVDSMNVTVAGGVESISLVQTEGLRGDRARDPWLTEHRPGIYWSMLETAELVAERYAVSRARQDELALLSQTRAGAAQEAGRFDAEIAPITVEQVVTDRATGEVSRVDRTVTADEGVRPETTAAGLSGLRG